MADAASGSGAQEMPPLLPERHQPSSESSGIEILDSGRMTKLQKRRQVHEELILEKCEIVADKADWNRVWSSAIENGWLCSNEDVKRIQESFSGRNFPSLSRTGQQESGPWHSLTNTSSFAVSDKDKPRWQKLSKDPVFGEMQETELVHNVAALANDIISQARKLPANGSKPKALWREAIQQCAFLAWESKGIEKRAVPDEQGEVTQGLAQIHIEKSNRAVSDTNAAVARQSPENKEESSAATPATDHTERTGPSRQPLGLEKRLPSTMLASSSQTPQKSKRKASRVLSEGYQALRHQPSKLLRSAFPLSGSDPLPVVTKPEHPTRGRSKPDALLLHSDHRAVQSTLNTLPASSKGKGRSKDIPPEKVIATEVRLIIEAKKGTNEAAYLDAVECANLEALIIKNHLKIAGNVYYLILAQAELTLYCANAGAIIKMPSINAEQDPCNFIRLIIFVSSHGHCRSYWDNRRSASWVDLKGDSPDYLLPKSGDTLSIRPLPNSLVTPDVASELQPFAGTLTLRSSVGPRDWYCKPARTALPFRLCGSRTAVFSANGIVARAGSESTTRRHLVVKTTFPKKEAIATEPMITSRLQSSAVLSVSIKRRLPTLVMFGRSPLDQIDPFEDVFGARPQYRVPTVTVFGDPRFHLYSLQDWQVSLVLADIAFLILVLWKSEGVVHHDISTGNVCSRWSTEHFAEHRDDVLGRFRQIKHILMTHGDSDWLEAVQAQDAALGAEIGSLIDFGNGAEASAEHDSARPNLAERQREALQTRSATHAFWSALDWERHEAFVDSVLASSRHGPEDDLEGLLYVFLAIESYRSAKSPDRRWTSLDRARYRRLANCLRASDFVEMLQTEVTVSSEALQLVERWKAACISSRYTRDMSQPGRDKAKLSDSRIALFRDVQLQLIEHAFELAGAAL
ncbi:unnamed protein product [Sympodiomycopsis kandeliae]